MNCSSSCRTDARTTSTQTVLQLRPTTESEEPISRLAPRNAEPGRLKHTSGISSSMPTLLSAPIKVRGRSSIRSSDAPKPSLLTKSKFGQDLGMLLSKYIVQIERDIEIQLVGLSEQENQGVLHGFLELKRLIRSYASTNEEPAHSVRARLQEWLAGKRPRSQKGSSSPLPLRCASTFQIRANMFWFSPSHFRLSKFGSLPLLT
ncbi:hypothetical protein M427DRAFT_275778 [Gonapodya prolifera JEL478]|uniref:Uncharacterized protein n=1 Tax=Gonapodya prolifera (strain JEL478) TaxID=1344416 RepID=A0A139AYL5_GONPJ|nr:hypothetical protein M427DRAFT_275778 [Gonapodya prolifera JEL478]|eukprot:KXS21653.1 hypothetical protein M427DRAFT_275778 [Gonapodya prolifera JEL478]